MSKISKILGGGGGKIFEYLKRAPGAPMAWDQCRKMVFGSIFGEITNFKKLKIFGQNFWMSKKGPRGPYGMRSM